MSDPTRSGNERGRERAASAPREAPAHRLCLDVEALQHPGNDAALRHRPHDRHGHHEFTLQHSGRAVSGGSEAELGSPVHEGRTGIRAQLEPAPLSSAHVELLGPRQPCASEQTDGERIEVPQVLVAQDQPTVAHTLRIEEPDVGQLEVPVEGHVGEHRCDLVTARVEPVLRGEAHRQTLRRTAPAGPIPSAPIVGEVTLEDDLAWGAFSGEPPWTVDPASLRWQAGTGPLRAETATRSLALARPRAAPPLGDALRVAARLGPALAVWYLTDRRHGRQRSRAGLSRRLRIAFEALGPTFIKLGQILSAGEGVFPEELVGEFRLCRDQVPAERFSDVRRVVEGDLGRPLEAVFSVFEREPLAAASIAQVHAARLVTGEDVVVKVQRPEIHRKVRRDLEVMAWLAPKLVGRIPVAALANPPVLVELFAETIGEELDFRLEADNMLDVARVLAQAAGPGSPRPLVVPRPHPELVTRRVLVMERLRGHPWGDAAALQEAGIDTAELLTAALIAFLEGLVLHGVFHGDLHPGNLLVREDGRVALLDFGITGRLDERGRRGLLRLVMSTATNDVRAQVRALCELGALPDDVDVDAVVRDLHLDQPVVDPTTMDAEQLTNEIREMTKSLLAYGARMPKALMLFVKDMLFIDNSMTTMAPDVDVIGQIVSILTHLQSRHGARIAEDLGVPPASLGEVDPTGIRGTLGLGEDVERLTHRELQARRRLIRTRLQRRHHPQAEHRE